MRPSPGRRYLWHSFADGLRGLSWALRSQWHLWLHLAITAAAVGLWLRFSPVEWALLAVALSAVLVAELANTALEAALDRLHPQPDPLIGRAKDLAAASVVVTIAAALIVGRAPRRRALATLNPSSPVVVHSHCIATFRPPRLR